MNEKIRKHVVPLKINEEIYLQLREVSKKPLAPSMTKIVEYGIKLALKELESRE